MFKFSSFLKTKKLLFLIILFGAVCAGLAYPSYKINAQSNFPVNFTNPTVPPATPATKVETPDLAESADELGAASILDISNMAVILGKLAVDGDYKIAQVSSYGLDYLIKNYLSKPITTDEKFVNIWVQIRNLGNMLIVLGFVVVGIATALRIQTYAATKLLWPLILIALLINFSGLFCGLIIDASNLVTSGLINGQSASTTAATASSSSATSISGEMVKKIAYVSKRILTQDLVTQGKTKFLAECGMFGAVYLGMAFTFLYLAILLIARYVILIMLYILSPLAFAFWIFPMSKHLWTEWWNHFLKWSFVGVFGSFVLYLTTIVITNLPALTQKSLESTTWANVGDLYVSIFIVMCFLTVGFKMSASKTGVAGMAGKAIMGLATGGAGLAMGAIGGAAMLGGKGLGAGARALDNKLTGGKFGSAIGNASRKISSSTGRLMDTMAGTPGARAGSGAKEMSEASGRIGSMDATTQAKIAMGKGMGGISKASDRAAATQSLAKSGKLWMLGDTAEEQARNVDFAENYMKSRGMDTSDFRKEVSKSAPALEAYNKPVLERIQRQHTNWSPDQVSHEAVVRAVAKMPEDALDRSVIESVHHSVITDAGSRMSDRKKEAFKKNNYNDMKAQALSMNAGPAQTIVAEKARALYNL